MIAGLQSDVKGRTAGKITRRIDGIHFGVRFADRCVIPLSDNPVVFDNHGTDHRIRGRIPLPLLCKIKGHIHEVGVVHR